MAALKQFLAALALIGIAVALFYAYKFVMPRQLVQGCTTEAKICPDGSVVGRSGPRCEFAPCPNGEALFEQDGVITYNNPGQPKNTVLLVYEQPGAPALSIPLSFDSESMCAAGTGVGGCMALNVGVGTAYSGKRVHVSGIDRGADLLVRRLEAIDGQSATSTPPGTDASTATVTARIGETVHALGVSITPIEIVDDSRCPTGVQCVWAGTVHVKIQLASGMGASTATIELGHAMSTEAELITLTKVAPPPAQGTPIDTVDYQLTFKVAKRSP